MALLGLSVWGKIAVTFVFIQISMMAVTLYLHRDQAHRAIDLHPALRHFFRLWIWLTSGMITREWVAVHRKHHAFCETENDPHSPVIYGLRTIALRGAEVYRVEAGQAGNAGKVRPRHPGRLARAPRLPLRAWSASTSRSSSTSRCSAPAASRCSPSR